MDIVKFTWRNKYGYWIPVAWVSVPTNASDERQNYPNTTASLREYASTGRPGMTDFRVLDRITIPEELRLTGRSRLLLSTAILHDKQADSYSAQQMLDAMLVQTA